MIASSQSGSATENTPLNPNDSIPTPAPRIARFENMAYGMFVHWGLYSQLGRGEWVMNLEKIPVSQYKNLKETFTAKEFDGRKIARIAKKAGMKYITLTARHHEGFSLYDTRGLSDWDVAHSPAGRDLVYDFVEGCRAEGISPFFYHTTLDWYQDSFKNDFNAYLDYLHQSIEILCTHYGEIGGFWFDGNWSKEDADWKEDRLYAMIRRRQPQAMIVNNTGLHKRGETGHPEIDSVTFEQGRPTPMDRRGMKKYLAAEMCQTMNRHWGIGKNDFAYMSPRDIIQNLCACRKVGANYLLNVGPTAEGRIPDYEKAALERAGDWVHSNTDAIYYAKPCGIQGVDEDFGLKADDTTYLFCHTVGRQLTFNGIKQEIQSIRWSDNDEELKFKQDKTNNRLTLMATNVPYGTNLVVRVAVIT